MGLTICFSLSVLMQLISALNGMPTNIDPNVLQYHDANENSIKTAARQLIENIALNFPNTNHALVVSDFLNKANIVWFDPVFGNSNQSRRRRHRKKRKIRYMYYEERDMYGRVVYSKYIKKLEDVLKLFKHYKDFTIVDDHRY